MQEAGRVRLGEHRVLGVAEYGDPAGRPVLYFHGGLSSRVDVRVTDAACRSRAVRLLSVDRPGIGLSDPAPGHGLLDWPKDIGGLLDALGIGTAGIVAWSGGAPYALACAVALPQRIATVVTVGGLVEITKPERLKEIGLLADRILFPLSRRAPLLTVALMHATRLMGRRALRRSLLRALHAPADRALVEAWSLADATDFFFEAMRQGAGGIVTDYRVMGGSWGFRPNEVSCPVHVLHGTEDDLVPRHHSTDLAASLPNGRFHLVEDAGHYAFQRHPGKILAFV
jgi:pimeloyl-ACP methyl ester carboxylesterase